MNFRIEELSMNAWPSLQTNLYDGWIIRFAKGYTKRANSVNPIYQFEKNFKTKLEHCEKIFTDNNLPVIFKLLNCDEHKIIDVELWKIEYEKVDLTSVQVSDNLSYDLKDFEGILIDDIFTEKWINEFIFSNKVNIDLHETVKAMLGNIIGDVIVVSKRKNGILIGFGYGAIEDGFVGIFDIFVKEEEQGNGYGKEIVKSILEEANKRGIKKSYLQVVCGNTKAEDLYRNLGFKEIYKYWYRRKYF